MIFRQNFLSHSAEKSRKGTLLCFTKFLVAKKLMDKGEREGGSIKIFRRIFLSHSAENFVMNTLVFH